MACGDPHSRIGAIYGSRVLFWGIVCKTFQEQLDGTVVVAPSPSKFDFNRPSPVSSKFWLPKILSWKKWNVKWGRWRNFVHFAHVGLRHLQAHWLFRVYLGNDFFTVDGTTTSEQGVRCHAFWPQGTRPPIHDNFGIHTVLVFSWTRNLQYIFWFTT